ncbi:PH domain-containing protein [Glaciibacter psychrotolerans]|uniref:Putative membrane protein n=1 Tax=Glaciibacter psychrotolerans TaxID=670054 RepID=A0A7Z0EIE9_9MICO|nr:PH domain-containing protein [Leifsonia psychrotolerans]NYJ21434.1 putative membrane protein [Leifsonia psychrotolerans]
MSVPATTPTLDASTLADGQWHRLHPASPLLRGGIFVFAILGFIVANLRERLVDVFFQVPSYSGDPLDEIVQRGAVGWALAGVALVLVVILVVFYLIWRMHTFRVSGDSVEVRSGLIFRSHRQARLDRIQGVNIVRPLIPRLFGAAKLEVSVAGQDANVQLSYLGSSLADGLRRDILRLASGVRIDAERRSDTGAPVAPGAQVTPGEQLPAETRAPVSTAVGEFAAARVHEFLAPEFDADAVPPASVVKIPVGRLLGSIVFSGFTVFLLLSLAALLVSVSLGVSGWLMLVVLPGLIGTVGYYFSRFTKSLRYSIAGTPDGVRVGFGLFSTTNETLPPGRIHAISVVQPLLWRGFGWWQVRINKAGHSSSSGAAGQANTTTLPVGNLADVAQVLRLILPSFDSERHAALVRAGLVGRGDDSSDGFRTAPRRAAWLRPFSWRRTGYQIDSGVVLVRRGVVSRELVLVPLARLQSVGIAQGPMRRMLRLASARLHTVAGPVFASLGVVDVDEARRLFQGVAAGAISSARSDTSHQWNQPNGDL